MLGSPVVWVIDPEENAGYQFKPNELCKRFDAADTLTGNGVLPDFECHAADLFAVPGETLPETKL